MSRHAVPAEHVVNPTDSQPGYWRDLATSPWLWGGALTWGVYAAIPHAGEWRPLLERYLAGHPVEYVQVLLFLVGLVFLAFKSWSLLTERHGLEWAVPALRAPVQLPLAARSLRERLAELPPALLKTSSARRLADLADYLQHRSDADGLEGHSQQLSEQALDRQHAEYAQLQTIIWAVPILGFLGTVMGITLSIANITPDQLETSLDSVTGGLAIAFDTTAVALVQSIVLVFAAFFVKRSESRLLDELDRQVFKSLVSPLCGAARQASPMVEAETAAARELLSHTETLINQQTDLWRESVEGLRNRWTQTIASQQQELSTALSAGMQDSLGSHAQLLAQIRTECLDACREFTATAADQLAETRTQHASLQQQSIEAWQMAWRSLQAEMAADRSQQQDGLRALQAGFAAEVQTAVEQLRATTAAIERQYEALHRQTELLSEIVGQEEQLAGLQSRLTENLQSLHTAETIQESVHSLTAAIHLLTARARAAA
jgi:biopolymer transport protein ExbB/TolQ